MPMQGWLATPTRRNALKGIFIAPAVLMLGVAVQSRPNYIDYDRLIDNQEVDRRITAYIDVVRTTETVLHKQKKDPAAIDRVAKSWIEGAEQGRLMPLPSQASDDSIHLGVKGQVLTAAKNVAVLLHDRGMKRAEDGQYAAAAHDIVSGMQVMQSLRYSDLTSVAVVAGQNRRMLRSLQHIWPRVPSLEKGVISGKLEELKPDRESIEQVLHQERKVAVVEESKALEIAAAQGQPQVRSSVAEDLGMIVRVAEKSEQDCLESIEKLQKG